MAPPRFALRIDERMFPVHEGATTIGRGAEADVRVHNDRAVSRLHARVRAEGDQLWLEDLDSHNGTMVNGWRVSGPTRIKHGDRITIGGATIIVQDSSRERFKTPMIGSLPPPGPDGETETLRSPRGSGPGLWIQALTIPDPNEREIAISSLVEQIHTQCARGDSPPRDIVSVATEALLQLASATGDVAWLDELDALHRACAHRPDPSVADRIASVADALRPTRDST
jgi:hypothetical protein